MSRFFKFYTKILETHPWKTQMLTAGVLMTSGDIICQTAVERKNIMDFQPIRTAQFSVLGTFFVGPTISLWYRQLERIFGASTPTIAVKKMLVDQVGFVPIFLSAFFVLHGFLKNEDVHMIKNNFKKDYLSVLTTNYMIWPAAQLVTFYVIPFRMRILFVSSVALFWNIYLTWKFNRDSGSSA